MMKSKADSFISKLWEEKSEVLFKFISLESNFGDIHKDYLDLPKNILLWLKSKNCGNRELSKWIKTKFKLEKCEIQWFEEEYNRLIFLSPKELEQLKIYTGAILSSDHIKKTLDGNKLKYIKTFLGKTIYNFVLNKSPLYKPLLQKLTIPKEYYKKDITEQIIHLGQYCLESTIAESPSTIKKLLLLKFPKNCSFNFKQSITKEDKKQILIFFRRIISKEICSPISSCF